MADSEHYSSKQGLEAFRIAGLPSDFYYIPNFISVEEEASILQKNTNHPPHLHIPGFSNIPDSCKIPAQRWTHLSHRRLQAVPSTLTKNNTLLASPLPVYLTNPIVDRFKALSIFDHTPHQQPNHVLINEYKPGEGIMPHEDGDAYAPVVATVSLGSSLCLDILPKPSVSQQNDSTTDSADEATEREGSKLPTRIYQEPRSLLVTTGAAYRELMHGIAAVDVDEGLCAETVANWELLGKQSKERIETEGGRSKRETRVSLTYRDVLKVSAAASKILGGLGKR